MNRNIAIGIVVTLVVIVGVWYAYSRTAPASMPAGAITVPITGNAPPLPSPTLGTILAIQGGMLTMQMQGATTSTTVTITPATLIYDNGAPISASALSAKETVAVIMYPQAVGDHIAQTITVVLTH